MSYGLRFHCFMLDSTGSEEVSITDFSEGPPRSTGGWEFFLHLSKYWLFKKDFATWS